METKKRLVLNFKNAGGKKVALTIDNPRENVTEEEIVAAMTLILSKNIFAPGGENLADLVDAVIVQTDSTAFDLVI